MKRNKRIKEKGITLVALVITIIILLILAGIAIASLSGDNGLFARANQAREETLIAQEDELRRLTMLEAAANLENQPYTDKNGDTATIPAGFAVSQVEGENTIADGLVIIDKNGNEFVWVPVNDDSIFKTYAGYSNSELQSSVWNDCEEPYSNGYKNEQIEYETMKNSVLKNDGFYVGRYETGTSAETGTGIRGNLIIKQGVNVYNNIIWGNSMTDPTEGAVELSKNFDTENGYTSVTSTLIYGVQWDAIMQWIDPLYKTGSCDTNISFVANSTGKGNYSGSLEKAGSNKSYAIKNIYDLGGNVSEWTMESYFSTDKIFRGGNYSNQGNASSSSRGATSPSNAQNFIGFRISLYLQT